MGIKILAADSEIWVLMGLLPPKHFVKGKQQNDWK